MQKTLKLAAVAAVLSGTVFAGSAQATTVPCVVKMQQVLEASPCKQLSISFTRTAKNGSWVSFASTILDKISGGSLRSPWDEHLYSNRKSDGQPFAQSKADEILLTIVPSVNWLNIQTRDPDDGDILSNETVILTCQGDYPVATDSRGALYVIAYRPSTLCPL